MQHKSCDGCNVDIILDMSQLSRKLESAVVSLGMGQNQEHAHRHRHSLDNKSSNGLDQHASGDFHRRLSLDEVDPAHFSETYCDRMSGIELDVMRVSQFAKTCHYQSCLQDTKPGCHVGRDFAFG